MRTEVNKSMKVTVTKEVEHKVETLVEVARHTCNGCGATADVNVHQTRQRENGTFFVSSWTNPTDWLCGRVSDATRTSEDRDYCAVCIGRIDAMFEGRNDHV